MNWSQIVTGCETWSIPAFSHDRFLCIYETVYHIGASLKDLGKKWLAFSRMEIGAEALREKM